MDNERETRAITTPSGVAVVINSYMTGGEQMDLEAVAIEAGIDNVDGRSGSVKMNAESAYRKRLRKLVDIMVISVAGESDKEKIWTALKNLKSIDYNFVMKEVETAAAGLTPAEIKK